MKILGFIIGLMLLSGCGPEQSQSSANTEKIHQYRFPALNESSLPPPPPRTESSVSSTTDSLHIGRSAAPPSPPAEINESTGQAAEQEMEEQVQRLRRYAAQASTNDPFALTEQEIQDFSKLDNPIIN